MAGKAGLTLRPFFTLSPTQLNAHKTSGGSVRVYASFKDQNATGNMNT